MRREAFTLIEIVIALAIIAALAAISIPAIYNAVMDIEEESVVESAMLGLRQFFVDARAKSVMNEELFELVKNGDSSLKFRGSTDTIFYSLPSGMRTKLKLDTPPGTFSYVLGMFLKEDQVNDRYVIEDAFKIFVKLNEEGEEDTTQGTLTINEGLPEMEYRQ